MRYTKNKMAEEPKKQDADLANAADAAQAKDAVAPTEERPRFIRTFAADMEAVKQGGRPDLMPFVKGGSPDLDTSAKPEAVPEGNTRPGEAEPISASSVVQTPTEDAAIEPSDASAAEDIARLKAKLAAEQPPASAPNPEARLVEGSALPEPQTVPEPSPEPLPADAASGAVQGPTPIHTYSGDFNEHLKDTRATPATVLAAEQDARGSARTAESSHGGGALYIIAGLMLLIAGGAGAYWGYGQYTAQPSPVILAPTVTAPIFVDDDKTVSGVGTALAQAVEQSATDPLKADAVRFLHFAPSASSTDSVFVALQLAAPGKLVRNINADGSMAGIINAGVAQAPFFILSVSSYGETFSGMLAWEPHMLDALARFYPPPPPPVAPLPPAPAATTTATTTAPASTTPPIAATTTPAQPTTTPGFRDKVVANHDARVYVDEYGRTRVIYGYWDQKTLVIARDEGAFMELVSRLANSRKQ